MSPDAKPEVSGAVILTRGIERLLRKLIRFLIGKMSLVRLQEMIKFIYVEESERKMRLDKPGRDVSLTNLALLTGLDTRTLSKVRNDEKYRKPLHEMDRFFKTMTPESRVLDLWTSRPEFKSEDSNEPERLKLSGSGSSFDKLVKDAVSSRGITTKSMLKILLDSKAIILHKESQEVELIERIQAPYKSGNHWGVLDVGIMQLCNLLDAVFHNYYAAKYGNSAQFFGKSCWTNRLSRANRDEFERSVRKFLTKTYKTLRDQIGEMEEIEAEDNQITAGVHMYYFEEERVPLINQ